MTTGLSMMSPLYEEIAFTLRVVSLGPCPEQVVRKTSMYCLCRFSVIQSW